MWGLIRKYRGSIFHIICNFFNIRNVRMFAFSSHVLHIFLLQFSCHYSGSGAKGTWSREESSSSFSNKGVFTSRYSARTAGRTLVILLGCNWGVLQVSNDWLVFLSLKYKYLQLICDKLNNICRWFIPMCFRYWDKNHLIIHQTQHIFFTGVNNYIFLPIR